MVFGMETLLDRQFDQTFVVDPCIFHVINPEPAAFSRMRGDCPAILAGDGDLHDFTQKLISGRPMASSRTKASMSAATLA